MDQALLHLRYCPALIFALVSAENTRPLLAAIFSREFTETLCPTALVLPSFAFLRRLRCSAEKTRPLAARLMRARVSALRTNAPSPPSVKLYPFGASVPNSLIQKRSKMFRTSGVRPVDKTVRSKTSGVCFCIARRRCVQQLLERKCAFQRWSKVDRVCPT